MPGSAWLSRQMNSRNGDGTMWKPASPGRPNASVQDQRQKNITHRQPRTRETAQGMRTGCISMSLDSDTQMKARCGLCNWIPSARDGDGQVLGTHWSASLAKRLHSRLSGRPYLKKEGWKWLRKKRKADFWPLHLPIHRNEHTCASTHTHCPTQLKDYKPSGRRVLSYSFGLSAFFLSWPSGDWMINCPK